MWQYPIVRIDVYLVTARQIADMGLEWFSRNASGQYFSMSRAMSTKMGMMRSACDRPLGPTVSPVVMMMPSFSTASVSALCQRCPGP